MASEEKLTYTMDGEINIPVALEEGVTDIPDHRVANLRTTMVELVRGGCAPADAAACCMITDWESDDALAFQVRQAEAASKCAVQNEAYKRITSGKAIPTGLQFWLKARCDWNDREDPDGFHQVVTIKRMVVKGNVPPQAGDAKESPQIADPKVDSDGAGS